MLRTLTESNVKYTHSVPKEGEIFKIIHLNGKLFEIRYGFYEERDRYTPYAEPIPIYPNFLATPQFDENGIPFVTAMQSPCLRFIGMKTEDSGCADCSWYCHGEELLGTCSCPANVCRKDQTKNE